MRFSLGHAFEFILTWNLWDLLWWFNCSDSSFSVKHYELLEALVFVGIARDLRKCAEFRAKGLMALFSNVGVCFIEVPC